VRLIVIHRRATPSPAASFLTRNAWKFGLGFVVAVLLTARTAGPSYTHPRPVATNVVPTTVPCGAIKLDAGSPDTATWTAVSSPYGTGSPYILPSNDPNLPTNDPTHPNCLKPDPTNPANNVADDIQVAPGTKLVIDGSQGPVQIFSHGTGIVVNGGEISTINTSTTNTVSFDAEPDVPSWDGIMIVASDATHKGDASFAYVSLQHALTAITISSGALSSPASPSYGLTVSNSGIGPSYFDGIDATNTPISVTGLGDGQFGTVNNIGSQGIKVTFDPTLPNYPAVIPAKSLDVENTTFGSSVPFGETNCVPLQPCAAGTIGNDAIQASFVPNAPEPLVINNNQFFRAGSYGLELANANNPAITGNVFTCNGSGSPTPVTTCIGSGLRFSAIYLKAVANLALGSAGLNNNKGQQNGLDAIVLNGQVVTDLTWQTPTNDSNAPSAQHPPHALGYMVANGDLVVLNHKLTVFEGDVVKLKGGAIVLTNGTLDAGSGLDPNGNVSSAPKTFTSMRDNGVGIQACPSVFVQSCPVPVPSNEWVGIDLSGSSARIDNANILFPTKAVDVSGSPALVTGPDAGAYSLVLTNSRIGPTFADSIATAGLPIYVKGSAFCTIDPVASDVNYGHCTGSGPGNHGINAGYSAANPAQGGLKVLNNDFRGSANEAILGTGLAGRPVDIENNTVEGAGTFGMQLASADNLTLRNNALTGTGAGTPGNPTTYPAIYLNGVSNADFSSLVTGNSGSGNGLNAITFHGSTATGKPLNWKTVGASTALGYMVDGDLLVNGDLTFFNGDVAPVLGGTISVKGGTLSATGARLTSMRQQGLGVPSCGSVFVLKVSGTCPPPAAGDWGGLVLDPGRANLMTGSDIGYAATGISVGAPSGLPLTQNLTLSQTNVHNTTLDGVHAQSPVAISGGAFTSNGGHAIDVILGSASPLPLAIGGGATVSSSGLDGILATGLAGQVVQIQGATVDHAGGYGIDLVGADHLTLLTLKNNTVTNSAPTFAAIYLNGYAGPFAAISGNKGAGNGLDALAFHGTVTDDLTWQTARKTSDPTTLLGYLLDGTLTMQPGHTLTVNAGDIVKVGKGSGGGLLDLQGVTLSADNTGSSSQKVFTSLTDNSAGVAACPSALLPGCSSAAAGDWGGIKLSGSGANGALVNAALRYASTGITISSAASSTSGSSTYGLTISRSRFDHIQQDAIDSTKTALSITDSTVVGSGGRGVNADLTGAAPGTPLRFSGNRFTSTGAEAVLGQALRGQPVWITDNQVLGAGTFGIRLLSADELVLRNNNITNSGGGPGAGAGRYPAIYLNGVTADFTRNIRGNVGSGNGLDVVAFHGVAAGDLSWQTPTVNASTKALGYVLDGSLVVSDGTLAVHPGDVVKSLGGPITISGGSIDASSLLAGTKLFTSLKDQAAYPQTCPSVLTGLCSSGPQAGDWGGVVITNDSSGRPGSASVANGQFSFAATALTIDSGPSASFGSTGLGLIVKGTTIADASGDGVNAQDTPVSVVTSTVQRVGVHGIVATFFGGTPCVSACGTSLDIEHVTVTSSGKDGIVASGLGGRPTIVNDNLVSGAGTYGIRLAGPDQLSLNRNTVNLSGGAGTPFRYPAIYLSGVKADFELIPGTTTVAANHGSGNGLDVIGVHGEASQTLTWLTTFVPAPVVAPPVPADHFGYLLDGALTVDGTLKTNTGDVVKVLGGAIHVSGSVQATGTTFTSLKDTVGTAACGTGYDSVFLQKASSSCPAAAAGDWAGISAGAPSTLTGTTIAFDDGLAVSGALNFAGGGMHDTAANAIVANGSPISVTGATFSAIHGDAIDSSNSGSTDTITDDTFDHVTGVAINLQTSPGDLERNVFTNDTNPTVKTSGAAVTVQCSSVQSGGIAGDAQLTVKENDFVAGVGVNAPAGAAADNNWWGQGSGPSGQLSGGVTVATYFATQNPTATIAITGIPSVSQTLDNVKSDGKLGTGRVQATITFSRNMNPEATLPTVTYASTPVSFDTGAWKPNDPRTWIGSAPIDALLTTNGTHSVSASGAHDCVPDPLHNLMTPTANTFTFVADTSTRPAISVSAADLIGAHSARLHGHIDPAGWATGAANSGQFVVINLANPLDQHLYSTPPLTDKTTAVDVSVTAAGLQASSTYSVQLQVPSVNGTAVEPTADTVTTTAAASKLIFTVEPAASVQAGATFSATAATEDPSGNVVSDFAGTATVALTVPGSATLSGTLTQPVASGLASFTGLSVNKTGSYTLTATSSPALASATSSSVSVTPGAATQLGFTVQPPPTPTSTVAMSPAIEVSIEDKLGNVVTGDSATQVTVALTTASGATLSGTTTQTASSGVASFANLSVDKTGTYTLKATSSPALASATSDSFTIQPGTATQLVFTVQPSSAATANTVFTQQPVVSLEDASGNVVTTDGTSTVTLGLAGGDPGAKLACTTNPITVTNGVASFAGCAIDTASGTPYQLTATSANPALGPVSSGNVTVS